MNGWREMTLGSKLVFSYSKWWIDALLDFRKEEEALVFQ